MRDTVQLKEKVVHTFEPVFDKYSKVLILGTIPSPMSRELNFYYSHPRNRFWQVLAFILDKKTPESVSDKKAFLLENKIAVWDVLKSCEINNAADSSISNPVANDMSIIFCKANIEAVFTTGKKATELYRKYCINESNSLQPVYLPSSSPANAAVSFDRLVIEYKKILEYL